MDSNPDKMIGRKIAGIYHIVKFLGDGRQSKVYLAEHKIGNMIHKVVFKILDSGLNQQYQVAAHLMKQYLNISQLGSPNTVRVLDFGETPSQNLFLVMEYVEGMSLRYIKQHAKYRTRHGHVDRILIQAGHSLQEAHQRGIAHQNLTLSNIFMMRHEEQFDFIKVSDFCLAKGIQADEEKKDHQMIEGITFGDPHYMSPEQFLGQAVDYRTDIYSLGVIAYELITDYLPIQAQTFSEWLAKHIHHAPTPIREYRSGMTLPEHKREAIMRALSKDPSERQQTVLEFLRELTGLMVPKDVMDRTSEYPLNHML